MTAIENHPFRMALIISLLLLGCGAIIEARHDVLAWTYLLWGPLLFIGPYSIATLSWLSERGKGK